jgi:hypothetical protein
VRPDPVPGPWASRFLPSLIARCGSLLAVCVLSALALAKEVSTCDEACGAPARMRVTPAQMTYAKMDPVSTPINRMVPRARMKATFAPRMSA